MKLELDKSSAASPNPVLRIDEAGIVLYSNKAGELLLDEWGTAAGEKLPSSIRELVQKVISLDSPEKAEIKVGKRVYLTVFHPLREEKAVCISGFCLRDRRDLKEEVLEREAQERVNLEQQEREIEVEFLSILNESKRTAELVHSSVSFFRERYGLEAVGLRLQEGNDYPYFETSGFPEDFTRSEHSLCARECAGQPIYDNAGNPLRECMCSNVICGRVDPARPCFTAKGSFWTNSTTELLASAGTADSKYRICSRCHSKGYESVALIALRVDENVLGLLQLNDTRKGQFSSNAIKVWERLTGYLAMALAKARVEEILLEAHERLLIQSEELKIQSEELQKANEALRENEEKYRNIVETASEGICLISSAAVITYVNKKMADMLGYTADETIGRSIWDFMDGEAQSTIRDNLKKRYHGINESYDIKLKCKDGSPLYVLINSKSFFDSNGKYMGSLSMVTDITKRKQTELALLESEMHFRTLAENFPDIITRFDRQHRHLYVNLAAVQSYDISLDKIIGKTQSELGRDAKNVKFWEKHIELAFATGKTEKIEYHYISPQGKKLYFNTIIVPEFAEGKIISVLAISRDITDIKEAEARLKKTLDNLEKLVKARTAELERAYDSLKESEKSLAEAQRIAHIGNMDWNLLTGEVYWSDELYRIFKRSPQESILTYQEFLSWVHPNYRDSVDNAAKQALCGKPIEGDYTMILANGEERKVHTHIEAFFDEQQKPVRMSGTFQDITEHKKAEEKIRNLANIVESSNDAIITESLDGVITSWNKGAKQIFGYSAEEILGKPISILALANSDAAEIKLTELIRQGKKIQHYETSRAGKDGKRVDVSLNLSPVFDASEKLTAISVIARDITERKKIEEKLRESEEKYRNIVETANEGIIIIDNEARITFANKKMADMLGYSLEENIGKPIWDFLSEESRAFVKLNLKHRWLGIDDNYELKLTKKNGSTLWVLVNAKPLFDKYEKYVGSMSMLTDITRRKEAEQALANFEIAREKEIHHRIKNNLQIVSSLLDLQAYKFKGRSDIKDSEVMDAFMESQNRVISMALIHEELYKGGGLETINFSAYIDRLADNLLTTYSLGNTRISLNKDIEADLFLDMNTAIPLGTIINELVSNSFKHAFHGRDSGEIRIELHRRRESDFLNVGEANECESPKSNDLILSVSDNGVSIPKSLDIENLDSLGLQLVTSLVEQLNGELEIKTNNGTEFVISFTVTEKQNKAAASATSDYGESTKYRTST